MTYHVMLFYSFFNSIRLDTEVSLYQQTSSIQFVVDNLQMINFDSSLAFIILLLLFLRETDLANVLLNYFVLLVNIYNVYVALFISCVQFLRTLIPIHASINCFVWIFQNYLLSSLCGLKPLKGLIVRNRKNQVFLRYQQYLDHSDSMNSFLLYYKSEQTVLLFFPVFVVRFGLYRLEEINAAFTIACINLQLFAHSLVETRQPDLTVQLRAVNRLQFMNSLIFDKPGIHEKLSCLVYTPYSHCFVSTRCNQQLSLRNISHIQNTPSVTNYCLETFVC